MAKETYHDNLPPVIKRTNSRIQAFVDHWRGETLDMALFQVQRECERMKMEPVSKTTLLEKLPYLHVVGFAGAFLFKSLGFPESRFNFQPEFVRISDVKLLQAGRPERVLINFLDNYVHFVDFGSKETLGLINAQMDQLKAVLCKDTSVTRWVRNASDHSIRQFIFLLMERFGIEFIDETPFGPTEVYSLRFSSPVLSDSPMGLLTFLRENVNSTKRKRDEEMYNLEHDNKRLKEQVTELETQVSEWKGKCVKWEMEADVNKRKLAECESDKRYFMDKYDEYVKSSNTLLTLNAKLNDVAKAQDDSLVQISERNSKLQGELSAAETKVAKLTEELANVKQSPNLFCSVELEHSQRIRQKQCERLLKMLKDMDTKGKQWKCQTASIINCLAIRPISIDVNPEPEK